MSCDETCSAAQLTVPSPVSLSCPFAQSFLFLSLCLTFSSLSALIPTSLFLLSLVYHSSFHATTCCRRPRNTAKVYTPRQSIRKGQDLHCISGWTATQFINQN